MYYCLGRNMTSWRGHIVYSCDGFDLCIPVYRPCLNETDYVLIPYSGKSVNH